MDQTSTLIAILKNIERILLKWAARKDPCAQCPLSMTDQPDSPRWLDRQAVMDYLGISTRTYQRLKADGTLRPRRIGGRDYYLESDLAQAMAESIRRGKV